MSITFQRWEGGAEEDEGQEDDEKEDEGQDMNDRDEKEEEEGEELENDDDDDDDDDDDEEGEGEEGGKGEAMQALEAMEEDRDGQTPSPWKGSEHTHTIRTDEWGYQTTKRVKAATDNRSSGGSNSTGSGSNRSSGGSNSSGSGSSSSSSGSRSGNSGNGSSGNGSSKRKRRIAKGSKSKKSKKAEEGKRESSEELHLHASPVTPSIPLSFPPSLVPPPITPIPFAPPSTEEKAASGSASASGSGYIASNGHYGRITQPRGTRGKRSVNYASLLSRGTEIRMPALLAYKLQVKPMVIPNPDHNSPSSEQDAPLLCVCREQEDGDEYIRCNDGTVCSGWCHVRCVGLRDCSQEKMAKLTLFVCGPCGESKSKLNVEMLNNERGAAVA